MSARKKYSQPKNIYFTDTSSMMYMLFIDLECKNGLLDSNEKDRGDIQKNRYDRRSSLKINYHAHHLCYVTNFNSRRASILIWRLRFQCKWWLLHFTLVLCVGYVNLSRVILILKFKNTMNRILKSLIWLILLICQEYFDLRI